MWQQAIKSRDLIVTIDLHLDSGVTWHTLIQHVHYQVGFIFLF